MSSSIDLVLGKIDDLKNELICVASKLISFQTISPPSNTLECAEYIKSYFENTGLKVSFYAREEGKVNVHLSVPGKPDRTIIWLGHLDVVPAGLHEKWIHNPFSAVLSDGKIYGRGASDMKGSCAAAMIAAKVLSELEDVEHAALDLWFTCDEEVGSPNGTRWLINEGLIRGDACLIGDSLSRNPKEEPYIDAGCKGYLRLRLRATGKTAHGSMPFYGDNAIDKLLLAIEQVKKAGSYALDLPADIECLVKESIEYFLRDEKLTADQVDAIKGAFNHPTISLTIINGGIKVNVIPDYAESSFDIRITPGVNPRNVAEKIRDLIGGLKMKGVEVEITGLEDGYYERWDSNFALSLRKAVEMSTGLKPKPKILMGATDAVPIKKALGIPCLGFGAGIEALAHAPNEYVTVDGVISAAKVYAILPLIF
ncbi:MAG: M20 family metallopeptidase [Candidatus Bathyarchaeia archaeon]|nr:M20 family metallopeptidase [Candidatus Bathyarchaeota archaeon]